MGTGSGTEGRQSLPVPAPIFMMCPLHPTFRGAPRLYPSSVADYCGGRATVAPPHYFRGTRRASAAEVAFGYQGRERTLLRSGYGGLPTTHSSSDAIGFGRRRSTGLHPWLSAACAPELQRRARRWVKSEPGLIALSPNRVRILSRASVN